MQTKQHSHTKFHKIKLRINLFTFSCNESEYENMHTCALTLYSAQVVVVQHQTT